MPISQVKELKQRKINNTCPGMQLSQVAGHNHTQGVVLISKWQINHELHGRFWFVFNLAFWK